MYSSYAVATAVCSVVFPVLASLAVLLRLRAREIKSLSYGTDDYTVIAALVRKPRPVYTIYADTMSQCLSISLACMVLYGAFKAGIGQLLSTMTPAQFTNYQKARYPTEYQSHFCLQRYIAPVFRSYLSSPCHGNGQNIRPLPLQKDLCSEQFSSICKCHNGIRNSLDSRFILCKYRIHNSHKTFLISLDASIFCLANIQLVELPRALYYQLWSVLDSFCGNGYLT